MSSFKHVVGGLATALLPVALLAFGAFMGAFQFLRSPEPVKNALAESGVYEVVVSEALAKAQEGATAQAVVPTDNPEVRKIIEQSIPPSFVEQQTEGAVDTIFSWLQGKNDNLQFGINVDQAKTQLADGLATYTQQYLDALPPCTGGEVPDPNQPLQATCKPAGFDSAAAAAKVKNDILANEQFLPANELNAARPQNDAGQSLEQTFGAVPAVYEQVRWGVYIAGVLALLSAVAVVACSQSWLAGLKRFGLIALIVGALSALLAWAVGALLQNVGTSLADEAGSTALQGSVIKAITLLTQDLRNWWLGYGLVLAGLGAVALVVRMVLMRKSGGEKATPAATPPEPSPTSTPAPTQPTTPMRSTSTAQSAVRPTRKLIQ